MLNTSDTDKISKAAQTKEDMYKDRGAKIRMTVDLPSEAIQVKRQQSKNFKVPKEKKKTYQPRILYPVKVSFRNNDGTKTFPGIQS